MTLVVDVSCWLHRYFHVHPHGVALRCASLFGRTLSYAPDRVAFCGDLPYPTFRHEIAKTSGFAYKERREAPDPRLIEQLQDLYDIVEDVFGAPIVCAKGYEADDCIATIVRWCDSVGDDVRILALDKDFAQLVSESVRIINGSGVEVGPAEVVSKYHVHPEQMRDYQAIVGDGADSIPGVPGMGPVAARRVLQRYGSIASAITCGGSDDKDVARLREHGRMLRACISMVSLSDVPDVVSALDMDAGAYVWMREDPKSARMRSMWAAS